MQPLSRPADAPSHQGRLSKDTRSVKARRNRPAHKSECIAKDFLRVGIIRCVRMRDTIDGALYIRVPARGADDPDGRKAAAILNAYVAAEHATACRDLLWRRLVLLALVAWLLETFSSLLPRVGLIV